VKNVDDFFKNKVLAYFAYYFLTPFPLSTSLLGNYFLAGLGSDVGDVRISIVFITVYSLWFFYLCLNFFLCGADGNPLELCLLAMIPGFIYAYLYFYCYHNDELYPKPDRPYSLFVAIWLIFSKSIIFLEDRRRPLI
jgi:hypothetical protein